MAILIKKNTVAAGANCKQKKKNASDMGLPYYSDL
jgi:hypothetical protein